MREEYVLHGNTEQIAAPSPPWCMMHVMGCGVFMFLIGYGAVAGFHAHESSRNYWPFLVYQISCKTVALIPNSALNSRLLNLRTIISAYSCEYSISNAKEMASSHHHASYSLRSKRGRRTVRRVTAICHGIHP
jgi:hypothetical protein